MAREWDTPSEKENTKKKHPEKKRKPEIKIRTMEIEDIAPIFHLGEKLFTHDDAPNLYRTWDEYEVVEFFNSDSELCLVADDGTRIVGFVLATIIDKRRSAWKYGYLVWIAVDEAYRHRNIGTRLFKEFLSIMEEHRVRMLLVDIEAENDEARGFFARMGFNSPQDHIYLSLNLSTRDKKEN
ncbi:MAG TPA: GNAT family N-acetyltransferase [Spirochaetota bacterium]|nr:GNAT family N-acetyltransferase [Spirochaetota bacterium]HQP49547.1 GNAT family N-acetyltransferase [Spirochaetota bacterium]